MGFSHHPDGYFTYSDDRLPVLSYISTLTKGGKYTNNSTRFQGKGKQRQNEKYTRNERGNFRRNDKGKGKGRSNEHGSRSIKI